MQTSASVVDKGGTVNVTATVTGADGQPAADGTEVLFQHVVRHIRQRHDLKVSPPPAAAPQATLTAPNDSGVAQITADFTDSTQTSRSTTASVSVVDPTAYSVSVSAATSTDLATIGASTTITATLYCGASPTSGAFDVTLIGPNNIGTFSLETSGGTVSSDGRSIASAPTNGQGQTIVDFASGAIGGAAARHFQLQRQLPQIAPVAARRRCSPGQVSLTVDQAAAASASAQFVIRRQFDDPREGVGRAEQRRC